MRYLVVFAVTRESNFAVPVRMMVVEKPHSRLFVAHGSQSKQPLSSSDHPGCMRLTKTRWRQSIAASRAGSGCRRPKVAKPWPIRTIR